MIVNEFKFIVTNSKDIELINMLIEKSLNSIYFKNKLILAEAKKDYFEFEIETLYKSTKKSRTNYKIYPVKFNIDFANNLYESLNYFLNGVMQKLPNLKTSQGYELNIETQPNGKQTGCLASLVYYKWLENNDTDLIEKATQILIRFCQGHFIFNGNKRSAILLATTFLYANSIYLYRSFNTDEYIKRWEKLVCEIVDKCKYNWVQKNDIMELEKDKEKTFSDQELFKYVYAYLCEQAYLRLF